MSRVIQHARTEKVVTYRHEFRWADDPHAGFSFPCQPDGTILNRNEAALANHAFCLANAGGRVIDHGIVREEGELRHPAVIRCDCGRHLDAVGGWQGTVECDRCERLYNTAGQKLNPPHLWGEETGETLSDLIGDPWGDE